MTILSLSLVAPLLTVCLLVLRRVFWTIRGNEHHGGVPRPPYALDWIPFLGHAMGMADEDTFWSRIKYTVIDPRDLGSRLTHVRSRYGPVVRVTALGETRVFVTSLPIIQHLYKTTKHANFYDFRKRYQNIVFGTSSHLSYSEAWEDGLYKQHHSAMQVGAIAPVLIRYGHLLEEEWTRLIDQAGEDGKVYDLESTVFRIIYDASCKALCGPTFPCASTIQPFLAFDKSFPLLTLSSLPSIALRPGVRARDDILHLLSTWIKTVEEDELQHIAPHLAFIFDGSNMSDWSLEDQSTLLLTDLWASQGNAPFAAIWTVAEIMRRDGLLEELNEEVVQVTQQLEPPTISTLLRMPQPDLVLKLPKINACLQETLRFYSTSSSIRIVLEDTVLPAHLFGEGKGRDTGLALKKDESVVCVTRPAHLDKLGEWGPTADRWDWQRMMGGKKGPMMSFGGGVSMCEGRHFASGELLTFLACFVSLIGVKLVPGEDSLQVDKTRVGLGMQHPQGKMKALIRRRR